MRPLTPAERRQIEQLKKSIKSIPEHHNSNYDLVIHLDSDHADMWLNIFSIILDTDDVLREQWRKSYGGVKNDN